MSINKYHKETKDADGEQLWWPGGPSGYPFRGTKPPTTTDSEYQDLQPNCKFKCYLFYLSNPEEYKKYIVVRDKCANNYFIPIDKERTWDEETKNYKVYLEWVEPAYELTRQTGVKDAIKDYTKETESTTIPYNKLSGLQNKNW